LPESGDKKLRFFVPDRYLAHHGANEKMVKSIMTVTAGCCHACLQPPHFYGVASQKSRQQPARGKAKGRRAGLF